MKSGFRRGCCVYEQHFTVLLKSKYQVLLQAKKKKKKEKASYVPFSDTENPGKV